VKFQDGLEGMEDMGRNGMEITISRQPSPSSSPPLPPPQPSRPRTHHRHYSHHSHSQQPLLLLLPLLPGQAQHQNGHTHSDDKNQEKRKASPALVPSRSDPPERAPHQRNVRKQQIQIRIRTRRRGYASAPASARGLGAASRSAGAGGLVRVVRGGLPPLGLRIAACRSRC